MMTSEKLELEGTWEEILKHSDELSGHRVRLTVLSPKREQEGDEVDSLPPENRRMLELLKEWQQTPLTEEELSL